MRYWKTKTISRRIVSLFFSNCVVDSSQQWALSQTETWTILPDIYLININIPSNLLYIYSSNNNIMALQTYYGWLVKATVWIIIYTKIRINLIQRKLFVFENSCIISGANGNIVVSVLTKIFFLNLSFSLKKKKNQSFWWVTAS